MGRPELGIDRTSAIDPSILLTSRRHIDLLRVCSAAGPLV
ncbi:putative leader peptide [Streptomyces sp. NBC_00370]